MPSKIAILGAGPVGMMLAVVAKQRDPNVEVALWSDPKHTTDFDIMKEQGFINATGVHTGPFSVTFSPNLASALHGAEDVYFAIPNFAFEGLVVSIRDIYDEAIATGTMDSYRAKTFLIVPGNYSAAAVTKILGNEKPEVTIEVSSSPINCRVLREQKVVFLKNLKTTLDLASYPADLSSATRDAIAAKFLNGEIRWLDSTLVLGFNLQGPKVSCQPSLAFNILTIFSSMFRP